MKLTTTFKRTAIALFLAASAALLIRAHGCKKTDGGTPAAEKAKIEFVYDTAAPAPYVPDTPPPAPAKKRRAESAATWEKECLPRWEEGADGNGMFLADDCGTYISQDSAVCIVAGDCGADSTTRAMCSLALSMLDGAYKLPLQERPRYFWHKPVWVCVGEVYVPHEPARPLERGDELLGEEKEEGAGTGGKDPRYEMVGVTELLFTWKGDTLSSGDITGWLTALEIDAVRADSVEVGAVGAVLRGALSGAEKTALFALDKNLKEALGGRGLDNFSKYCKIKRDAER